MPEQITHSPSPEVLEHLIEHNFLFKELNPDWLTERLHLSEWVQEKLYSNRPIYTAFRPNISLEYLYLVLEGGPIITRSTPLDRIISITYSYSCFGMRNLNLGYGRVSRSFPSLVEAYKTTDVVKIPLVDLEMLYQENEQFRDRYDSLFELREKFQYHLLNCSSYPPQAVAALLRALVYQERFLGNQPNPQQLYELDLPIDIIARACQLNHRTVEQVIKGMTKVGLLKAKSAKHADGDLIYIADPEGLKEVYSATRDKVSWWPLQ
ncbi:hypothetical protein [Gloeocapsa sp. PCC 73106]|uniref:hypothetical protein n=1 Tax=Gloeocapsa sp. PCC 73106 TaxID=102232 RepID=UPI0002ABA301|nr:hypothetical protein [Gloeocapsa sp. PCC 73106]ELR99046.1 cAMP-binding protein [Gloeocapsa sp. PCC 73106]